MPPSHPRGDHEDTVFVNGRILTMDAGVAAYVEAVVIQAGLIAFVGERATAAERYPDAFVRDLQGSALLPGFIDAHSHMGFAFDLVDQVNVAAPPVGPCASITEVLAALEAFRDERGIPAGGWIIGWGYDQETLVENRHITASDVDRAFPDNPVALIHVSTHGAVLNSAALAAVGVGPSTPTPAGGVINRVAGTSQPEGLLMETAYLHFVRDRLPRPDTAQRLELLDAVQQMYASQGYTHVQDGFTSVADLDFFKDAASRGLLYLDVAALGSFLETDTWMGSTSYPVGQYVGGLKLAGMKILQDGSPQGRTAFVTEPYLTGGPDGSPGWRGEPTMPFKVFDAKIGQAVESGTQIFIHANGDAAIDAVIRSVRGHGVTADDDRRTVVIHSQFQRPDHLADYADLGISPSYFTNHVYFWGDVHVTNIGPEKAAFISPVEAATALGIVVSNHTDFTVTPLDPFFTMWTAMARTTRTGEVLGPDQRIDAYTALQLLTTGGAHQMFEEDRKGRIAEGLLADFVILSEDPIRVPVDDIRSIRVIETIKEGVSVYRG